MAKEAEANKLLLTSEFLELKRFEAMTHNQKVYFGPNIPNNYVDMSGGSVAASTVAAAAADKK